MSHSKLSQQLGLASSKVFTQQLLDQIHEALHRGEDGEPVKIPVTLKYAFAIDKEGYLSCDVTAKANLPLEATSIRLRSHRDQLELWDTRPSAATPAPAPKPNGTPPPSQSARTPSSPSEVSAEGVSPKVAERKRQLVEEARKLYEAGKITRGQAIEAGVSPSVLDGAQSAPDEAIAKPPGARDVEITDLTPEERVALQSDLSAQ